MDPSSLESWKKRVLVSRIMVSKTIDEHLGTYGVSIERRRKHWLTVEDETARRRLCGRDMRWRIMNDGGTAVESWSKKRKNGEGGRCFVAAKDQKKIVKFLDWGAQRGLVVAYFREPIGGRRQLELHDF
jgi:hypothetical protein